LRDAGAETREFAQTGLPDRTYQLVGESNRAGWVGQARGGVRG
jgi:hypothetical protein